MIFKIFLLCVIATQSLGQENRSINLKTSALSRLDIDPSKITVSGVSSGGFFAVQLQVTYSKLFKGVGVVAGGIYWCSEGVSADVQSRCMSHPEKLQAEVFVQHARAEALLGAIDPLHFLADTAIYIYASPEDYIVHSEAGEMLTYLDKSVVAPTVAENPNSLTRFDQSEFTSKQALLYHNGLHVALHGCQMSPDFIQDSFVVHSGLNRWAEQNKLVILYPQSVATDKTNPQACWDWYGFTGPNFANKNGPQMQAIKAMVDRIVGNK